MIFILTILNLFCLFILLVRIFCWDNLVKVGVLAVSVFSLLYVIISGLFFWFDAFSFVRVLVTMLILAVLLIFYTIHKGQFDVKQLFNTCRVSIFEIVLIVAAIFLSIQNFELYESGQDQGLYQVEAIELYMDNYEVEHDFEEYKILEREQDKEAYKKMLTSGFGGYYPLSDYKGAYPWSTYRRITYDDTERLSDVSGMYHGIQTFPAIMALGGKLFGLENMMQVQTIFFVCSVMLLYFSFCNISISRNKRLGALMIFLLSPLALWISKTAFTEMILTLCISFYLFLQTESDTKIKRYLISLPLVAFSFVHVSFLQILPVFVLINILLYLKNKQREYLYVNVIASIGLIIGYFMMAYVGPRYFFDNVSLLYFKNIITAENFLYWICLGSILISIFSLLMIKIKDLTSVYKRIFKFQRLGSGFIFVMLLVIIFNIVLIAYFSTPEDGKIQFLCHYYGTGLFRSFLHSSIFAFAMATGIFILPCILWYMIRYRKNICTTSYEIAIYFLFMYCVLFQSAFIRKEVHYYYYYSRYMVFYVPIICFAFAIMFKNIKKRTLWAVLTLSVVCMTVFDVPLLTQNDQTMLEWESLQDLDTSIQDDSAIILDPSVQRLLGPDVRAISGEAVFPVMEDTKYEIQLLRRHYRNIYYLSDNSSSIETLFDKNKFEITYRDKYIYQSVRPTVAEYFPLNYPAEIRELVLYEYKKISADMYSIGVINGERKDDYIISTGIPGLVIYGPYCNLAEGDYYLRARIEIDSQSKKSLGNCYIGNVSEGDASIMGKTPVENFLHKDNGNTYLYIPFHIDKYTENIEFKIEATEDSIFKIYPYILNFD